MYFDLLVCIKIIAETYCGVSVVNSGIHNGNDDTLSGDPSGMKLVNAGHTVNRVIS
jgi:hypothetical protein